VGTTATVQAQRIPSWVRDVIAGLSVTLILIPQSLAYADLAGLPPHYGLYAAMLPPIAAAVFASSPYLQTGPVAMTSLLAYGALAQLAEVRSADWIALAALLALTVGVIRLLLGIVRAGWVAYLMSHPMLTGFMAAAAIIIVAAQLPTALGTGAAGGTLLGRAVWSLAHPAAWELESLVLATVTVALILGGSQVHRLFPGVLLAVIIGILFSTLTGYQGPTVGEVPSGLPPFSLSLPWGSLPQLLLPALVIAFVGFAEAASISRTYATQERQSWSPDREFVSQGVANLAAGISGGFPVGGSFSRTSVNRMVGARTRLSGAITGLGVLLFLPVASVLAPLPRAVLAAIVIAAVARLIVSRRLVSLLQHSLPQAAVAWATFLLTLALAPRIDEAVMVGVVLAIVVHLWRELRMLVRSRYEDGSLYLIPEGVLFFASAPGLQQALLWELAAHPAASRLTIDLSELGRIDQPGAEVLQAVIAEAESTGLETRLVGIPDHARRILTRVLGPDSPLLRSDSVAQHRFP
jgi:SulP family sulfate permease